MLQGLVLLVFLTGMAQRPESANSRRPNILFLFADDMRADALGVAGNPNARTPQLDELARRGVVFTRAYIMGGNSNAVCVPSRAMMLSGRSLFQVDLRLSDTPTWPMKLRKVGYRTYMTGKWHNGAPSLAASFPETKLAFLGGMASHYETPFQSLDQRGRPGQKRIAGRHSSEVIADEAIRLLAQAAPHAPWALYVAFTAPHDPREAPASWRDRFAPETMVLPPNFLPQHPFDNGDLLVRDEHLADWPRTPEAIRLHLAQYHALIGHLDEQVGRILAALNDSGQRENTIVIFSADNGLAIGSHGLLGKQNLYEHSIRIPLIVSGPMIEAPGRRTDALVYLFDLCPTLCELAGARSPEGGMGKSLVPLLKGTTRDHRTELFFAYLDVQRAVADGRWKAIFYPKVPRWQLFDLAKDPFECNDLAEANEYSDKLRELKARLHQWRRLCGDS